MLTSVTPSVAHADPDDQRAVSRGLGYQASWLPDGSGVVYATRRSDDNAGILVRQSLTSTVSYPLSDRDDPEFGVYEPVVSPDGSRVLFVEEVPSRNPGSPWPSSALRILDLSTGEVTDFDAMTGLQMTSTGSWSPDGNHIVFVGQSAIGADLRIYTAAADGTGLTSVSDPSDREPNNPSWSATGAIAYDTRDDEGGLLVRLIDPDGTSVRTLANHAFDAAFSPAGDKAVVTMEGDENQLVVIDTTDGTALSTFSSSASDQQPAWSPDGNYLAFTRQTPSTTRIWVRSFGPDIPPARTPPPPSVSIDDAAVYTDSPQVTLTVQAPERATEVTVSNDGGFGSSKTFAVTDFEHAFPVPWTLRSSGPERLPKTVYVRFDVGSTVFTDDIVLDETDPVVSASNVSRPQRGPAARAAARHRVLTTKASDNRSGVRRMQVGRRARADGARTYPFQHTVSVPVFPTTFVRVQDGAGNWSTWRKARMPG